MRLIIVSVFLLFSYVFSAQNTVLITQNTSQEFNLESLSQSTFSNITNFNQGLNNGTFWFKIYNDNQMSNVLQIPSTHIDNVSLYSSKGIEFGETVFSRFPTFSLDKYDDYPLYMKVNMLKEAYFPITITPKNTYLEANQKTLFKLGGYYGFAIMVILINLMCFILFDEKVFLHYLIFLSTVTLSFFYSDGLFHLFGFNGAFSIKFLEPILHIAVAIFGAYFATNFLKLYEYLPKLKWLTSGFILSAAILFTVNWINGQWIYAAIAEAITFSILAIHLLAGITLFKSKVYARFYVVAYSLFLFLVFDYFVFKNFGINFLSISSLQLKVAGILEMIVLTYAIMYRMRSIKEENELMQTEMRIYLKRIEMMRLTENIQMVDDIYIENLIDHYNLSHTETRLLQYISDGNDNTKIARKLNTTEKVVEKITKELYQKLEIGEQVQEDYRIVDEQPDYIYN